MITESADLTSDVRPSVLVISSMVRVITLMGVSTASENCVLLLCCVVL
jgi:hypothetical protein